MGEPFNEELIKSETAFQGRLLTLRIDTVRISNGFESTREVVVHPGAVAMVPLLDAEHVLFVRQWRTAAGRALLEIPAGTLEPGEDPRDTAVRELQEEIGYRPQTLTHLCSVFLAPGYSSELIHIYLAEGLTPAMLPHDDEEEIEVVSLTWAEIDDWLARGEFADAKTVSGLLLAQKICRTRMRE